MTGESNIAFDLPDMNNIAFDLPDMTDTIDTPTGGHCQLDAYKSVYNDRIFLQTGTAMSAAATSQLI